MLKGSTLKQRAENAGKVLVKEKNLRSVRKQGLNLEEKRK